MAYNTIRPRSGTAREWATANPILLEREIGFEVPDGGVGKGAIKMKMGNGVSAWHDLPYAIPIGLTKSDIVNNTTTNDPEKLASAEVAYHLDSKINSLTTRVETLETPPSTKVTSVNTIPIPNVVTTKIAEFTVSKGNYLVLSSVLFSGNTSGMRAIAVSSETSMDATKVISTGVSANPWTNISTRVRYSSYFKCSKETTLALYAYQNSGSELSAETADLVVIPTYIPT